MIDHTGVNVTDIAHSKSFYKRALASLGYDLIAEFSAEQTGDTAVAGFGVGGKPDFWLGQGQPQSPHVHIAFRAGSKAQVDQFYREALAAGGRDNGAPGPRPHYHPNYYGTFVYDFDGHNIEAVFHG